MRLSLLIMCLMGAACSNEALPPLVVSDVEISAPMPGNRMSAGYLVLQNNGSEVVSISHVSSPDFQSVEIHESLIEDGVSRMRRVDKLVIPPSSTVTLQRGGKHLMLMQANGSGTSVSLNFYDHDLLLLSVRTSITPRLD